MTLFWIFLFCISLYILIQASLYFTGAAESWGVASGIPPFMVGVTIVAIGTSLPELVSSLVAVFDGAPQIVIGNVVGSNIANIFLILGVVTIMARRIRITRELLKVDLSLLVGVSFMLAVAVWDGNFTRFEAILFTIGFLLYTLYALNLEKIGRYGRMVVDGKLKIEGRKTMLTLLVAPLLIYAGAFYTVEAVVHLASLLQIGAEMIAISAIALGTSLPELAVSIAALRKGKAEMAVGNILGSNIFNTLAVMGIPGLFGVLIIPDSIIRFGLPVMLMATFLYFFVVRENIITRWEGWLLIVFYVFFLGELFMLS